MILRRIRPFVAWGRWSAHQASRFGLALGSVGYVAIGPVALIFNLPERLQIPDHSLFDLNAHLAEIYGPDHPPVQLNEDFFKPQD